MVLVTFQTQGWMLGFVAPVGQTTMPGIPVHSLASLGRPGAFYSWFNTQERGEQLEVWGHICRLGWMEYLLVLGVLSLSLELLFGALCMRLVYPSASCREAVSHHLEAHVLPSVPWERVTAPAHQSVQSSQSSVMVPWSRWSSRGGLSLLLSWW